MKQKIITLLNQLNHGLVEREETLKTALLTVLAGENIVLIGPPGTGKSMLARRIADGLAVDKGEYFEYLLTKFSTPEEIFGPLSITELKQDRFKRNTAGYLPTVKMAFLDEIFKASSSILNALLTILNERVYHNGAEPQKVPLRGLIAASNELPTDQEELSALYDRFLVRGFVDYVKADSLKHLFNIKKTISPSELNQLSAADLQSIDDAAESVRIPQDIVNTILRIWRQHKETFKEDRRESLSDRRLVKVLHLLRVSAATNGRTEVDLSDVLLLKDCLWNHQDNAIKVRELTMNSLIPAPSAWSLPLSFFNMFGKPSKPSPLNFVITGFKGCGTKDDPFLIESIDNLVALERYDISQKGYYFRQITDLDCTELHSWISITVFYGHYNGDGYSIKYKKNGYESSEFFGRIQSHSSITELKLKDLSLAKTAEDAIINSCSSTMMLINEAASNCIIINCQTDESLIGLTARNCIIKYCTSGSCLIFYEAINCSIEDCLVEININSNVDFDYDALGGIARTLECSNIRRCFVTGQIKNSNSGRIQFYGIAATCEDSNISQCALGKLDLSGENVSLINHIADSCEDSDWEYNISIDTNKVEDEGATKNVKTIKPDSFNQKYFEQTLGWDFENVWDQFGFGLAPTLRSKSKRSSADEGIDREDLLIHKMRANIWLGEY